MANPHYDGGSEKVRARCSCEMESIPVLEKPAGYLVVEPDRGGLLIKPETADRLLI